MWRKQQPFHLMNYATLLLLLSSFGTLQCIVSELTITLCLCTAGCLPVDGDKLRVEDQSCSTY
jgi:hypothetical protein